MRNRIMAVLLSILCMPHLQSTLSAQSQYLTEKKGVYSFKNNSGLKDAERISLGKNVKTVSDFFRQNIPIMKANKGFDLAATLFGYWDDNYQKRSCNYGLRGELRFDFQLFLKEKNGKEEKWTVEPPLWSFDFNNTETGHGGNLKDGSEDSLLKELFLVFPLVSEITPGVRYYDCPARTCGSLVVFNPARPSYWLPVTVKEVADAKLKFYKGDKNNKMLYDFIKPIIEKMSGDELKSLAYYGSEDGILNVNGKKDGLQIMRFNQNYWDRTLPPSAIQFITIGYSEYGIGNQNESDKETADTEYFKSNGHPNYSQVVRDSLPIRDLPKLIAKTGQ